MLPNRRRVAAAAVLVMGLLGWLALPGVRSSRPNVPDRTVANTGSSPRATTGSLSGTVRAADGSALSNARVCAAHVASHLLGHVQSTCARTGGDGRYAIGDLAAGAYDVSAIAPAHMPAGAGRERNVVVMPRRDTPGVDFVLQHGGARLAGTVIDATGGPIEGASLALWFGNPATRKVTVESDADGHFTAWVTPGPVGVTANASGYTETLAAHVAPSSDLTIRMSPGSTIQGIVVSVDGATPVAGVEVRGVCDRCFDSAGSPAAASSMDGRFEIKDLAPGTYRLSAEGEGWRGGARDLVSVGLAQTTSGVVVLVAPARQVAGTVQRTNGEPCVRGTVQLGPAQTAIGPMDPGAPAEASPLPVIVAGIGEAGDVRFRSVPSGVYHAAVHCEDHVLADGPTTISVGADKTEGLVWRVRPGLQLTVHVVDAADRPRANTYFILAMPGRTKDQPPMNFVFMTDANGHSKLQHNLAPGTYELQPYQAEGDPVTVQLRERAAPAEATLRLRGRGSIELTVRTPDGVPIDSVRITAVLSAQPAAPAAPDGDAARQARVTRALNAREASALGEGRFQFASLSPGTYDVEVDDGLNAPILRTVRVGDQSIREEVVLDRDQTIQGRVVGVDGQPQADVWVTALCAADSAASAEPDTGDLAVQVLRETRRVISDVDGRFMLTHVSRAARSCTLRAEEPGSAIAEQQGVVPGREAVISMRALGRLSGTARSANGRAVTEFVLSVVVDNDEGRSRAELITGSGDWSLARVPPGNVTLSARTRTGDAATLNLELAPGATRRGLQLVFAPAEPNAALAN